MLSLAEENDILKEQNRQLKEMLTAKFVFSLHRYFARNHLRMLDVLSRQEIVSREMFFEALYYDRRDSDLPDDGIVAVLVSSLRKKLKVWGIQIHTRYNVGWYLDPESKKKLNALCEAERVAA